MQEQKQLHQTRWSNLDITLSPKITFICTLRLHLAVMQRIRPQVTVCALQYAAHCTSPGSLQVIQVLSKEAGFTVVALNKLGGRMQVRTALGNKDPLWNVRA